MNDASSGHLAALEVVKRRLDKARLGDYVLELHSRHAAKRGVVNELKRCLERDRAGEPAVAQDTVLSTGRRLQRCRRKKVHFLPDFS